MDDFDNLCQTELQQMEIAERSIQDAQNLTSLINSVVDTGEFGLNDVETLESLVPGLVFENYPMGGFSAQRSPLNAAIGLEMAMDAKRLLLVGGIAALFGAIFAAIRKFMGGGGGSSGEGGSGGGGSSSDDNSTSSNYTRAEKAYKDMTPKLKDVQKKLKEKKEFSKSVEDALAKCYHAYVRLTKRDPGLEEFIRLTKEHPDKLMPNRLTSSMFSEDYLRQLSYDMFSRQDQSTPSRCVGFLNKIDKNLIGDRVTAMDSLGKSLDKVMSAIDSDKQAVKNEVIAAGGVANDNSLSALCERFGLKPDYLQKCEELLKESTSSVDVEKYKEILDETNRFIQQCFHREERVTFTDATFESFWTSVQKNSASFDKAVEFTDKLMKAFSKEETKAKNTAVHVDERLREIKQFLAENITHNDDATRRRQIADEQKLMDKYLFVANRSAAEIKSMVLITGRIGSHTINIGRLVKGLADHIEAYDKAVDKLLSALERNK